MHTLSLAFTWVSVVQRAPSFLGIRCLGVGMGSLIFYRMGKWRTRFGRLAEERGE